MDMINVKINGIAVSVPQGSTVLEAARVAGVEIPTLCFMKEKNEIGACRICMVEVNEGRGFRMVTACVFPCSEGMEVITNSEKVQKSRTIRSAFLAHVLQIANFKNFAATTA